MFLFGLETIQDHIQTDIVASRVKHAYLFVGPPSTGKMTLCAWFAQQLQCVEGGCGECQTCLQILHGTHVDTLISTDDGEGLSIDHIREKIGQASLTFTSKYFIFIIENIERASLEGVSALLKTLEEPHPGVIFLLTASHTQYTPATLLSRVTHFTVPRCTRTDLQKYLRDSHPAESDAIIDEIILLGQGRIGKCISLLANADEREEQRQLNSEMLSFGTTMPADRILSLMPITDKKKDKDDGPTASQLLQQRFDRAAFQTSGDLSKVNDPALIIQRLENLKKAKTMLERNVNPNLVSMYIATRI